MKTELTTSPSSEDAKTISQGLVNFNHKMIPALEPEENKVMFSIFVRDDEGVVIGGLRGLCYWNTLHIELLWLSELVRANSVGSQLVREAEAFAVSKGFKRSLLFTTSWQAKPFYELQGYKLQATIPDYPEGHSSHLMTKALQ